MEDESLLAPIIREVWFLIRKMMEFFQKDSIILLLILTLVRHNIGLDEDARERRRAPVSPASYTSFYSEIHDFS